MSEHIPSPITPQENQMTPAEALRDSVSPALGKLGMKFEEGTQHILLGDERYGVFEGVSAEGKLKIKLDSAQVPGQNLESGNREKGGVEVADTAPARVAPTETSTEASVVGNVDGTAENDPAKETVTAPEPTPATNPNTTPPEPDVVEPVATVNVEPKKADVLDPADVTKNKNTEVLSEEDQIFDREYIDWLLAAGRALAPGRRTNKAAKTWQSLQSALKKELAKEPHDTVNYVEQFFKKNKSAIAGMPGGAEGLRADLTHWGLTDENSRPLKTKEGDLPAVVQILNNATALEQKPAGSPDNKEKGLGKRIARGFRNRRSAQGALSEYGLTLLDALELIDNLEASQYQLYAATLAPNLTDDASKKQRAKAYDKLTDGPQAHPKAWLKAFGEADADTQNAVIMSLDKIKALGFDKNKDAKKLFNQLQTLGYFDENGFILPARQSEPVSVNTNSAPLPTNTFADRLETRLSTLPLLGTNRRNRAQRQPAARAASPVVLPIPAPPMPRVITPAAMPPQHPIVGTVASQPVGGEAWSGVPDIDIIDALPTDPTVSAEAPTATPEVSARIVADVRDHVLMSQQVDIDDLQRVAKASPAEVNLALAKLIDEDIIEPVDASSFKVNVDPFAEPASNETPAAEPQAQVVEVSQPQSSVDGNVVSPADSTTQVEAASSPEALERDQIERDKDIIIGSIRDILTNQFGSTSMVQRRQKVGFAKAGRIMSILEQYGIVGSDNGGAKAREVLMTSDQIDEAIAKIYGDEQKVA